MKTAFFLVGLLSATAALGKTGKQTFNLEGVNQLLVRNGSGLVEISPSEDGKAHLTTKKIDFGPKCSLITKKTGQAFLIEIEKSGLFNSGHCKINLKIEVPASMNMDLKNGSGDVKISGTKSDIDFVAGSGDVTISADSKAVNGKTGSGSVKATGTFGQMSIKSGSGSTSVDGVAGTMNFKAGSGDLKMTYKSIPKKAQVSIKVGSGNATIYVPKKVRVITDFSGGSGQLRNEVQRSSGPELMVSMKSGSGDLNIKASN